MKKKIKLLIVEDDPVVISTYESNIKSFNKTNDQIEIIVTVNSNKDQAISLLRNSENSFDGAIIDLDLKNSGGSDSSGNEIVKEIKETLRFPVFVISGTSHNLEKDLSEETSFFKVRERDDADFDYLTEFIKIFDTGITQILNRKGIIEKNINDIFWKHLSGSLGLWINDTEKTPENKQKSLLRYVLSHLQEYLELTEESDFDTYHPAEIYIMPPVKNKVFTGDLVEENATSKTYIVVTPSCDLAQSKAKEILLAEIEPDNVGLLFEKINILKKNTAREDVIENAEKDLKSLINNSYSNKYHFLPKYNGIKPGLINFQKLKSIRVKVLNDNFSRKASINSTFTKDIIARFSYYYSRQGSPDFNVDEIYDSIIKA